ncbi:hypothetical protein JEG45_13915, partial [Anoxybacillus sp. LAT_31]|nr:hypothetical protein [Anoxybacillus sp. LAT_31]
QFIVSPPWFDDRVNFPLTPLHHTKRAFFFQVPENLSNRNAPCKQYMMERKKRSKANFERFYK